MGLASRLSAAQASSGAPPPAQQQQSYAPPPPAQSYAPPPGAPPQGGQYGAAPPAYSDNGYNPYAQGGKSIYAPPPGPPPALQPGRPASQYAPPPGAPPVPGSSYPGQQQQQQSYGPPPGAPPQPYGAPPPSAGGHANAATDYTQILRLLQHTVTDQHIEAFYPPGSGRLEHVAQRVAQTGVLAKVAQDWRMPLELAMDLAKLALFDVVLYCDDSGSMQFEEGGSRIDDLKLIVQRAAFAASLFDDDGIEVRFMNSQISGRGIKSEADAMALVNQVRFSGLTPLGTALDQKVLQPLVLGPARQGALQKPVVVIAVTDGVPGGESRDTLVRVIVNASRELARTRYGPDALSVTLAQIGNDQKARAFLEEIDEHPEVGGLVDCTSNYENEEDNFRRTTGQELTPELWLMKLLLGSVSSDWDLKDETK